MESEWLKEQEAVLLGALLDEYTYRYIHTQNTRVHTECIPVRQTLTDGITHCYNSVTVLEHTQRRQLTF